MTPARSLAASVIALGFASSLTAPPPAAAAPALCDRAEDYAAQSGAEMLRIDRLDLRPAKDPERPAAKSPSSSRRESGRHTESTGELLRPASDLADGDFGHSGQGATGFLSGTSDLLKSVTEGRVTAPTGSLHATGPSNGPVASGGQGGGGPIDSGGQGGGGPIDSGGQGGGGPIDSGGRGGGGPIDSTEPHRRAPAVPVAGVGLGETRTALVATARTNSAAVARTVDGKTTGQDSLTRPLAQQAPPTAQRGVSRSTAAATVGPVALGPGGLSARAQWDAAMACGHEAGEAARSVASLDRVDLLGDGGSGLLGVPGKISSRSTTALERHGDQPVTVAEATVTVEQLTLAAGKIKLRVLRPPALTARMGTGSGGEVRYQPAAVEVSGPGVTTKRLSAAGDSVDISLGNEERTSESASLSGMPPFDGLVPGTPLALPQVPGLPSLGTPETESAHAIGDGTQVRISLGAVRQASTAHAIAAKAAAIDIEVSVGAGSAPEEHQGHGSAPQDHQGHGDTGPAPRGHQGYGGGSVVAELGVGLLEAAAVSPEAAGAPTGPGVSGPGVSGLGVSGSGGGLPVTGPPAGLIALAGAGLVLAGGAALVVSRRRRRPTG